MNQTERRYEEILKARMYAGEILWYRFEALRLRIGEDNAWYCPDFLVMTKDLTLEIHEIKGAFVREASIVRLKAAATLYPFRVWLCKYAKSQWSIDEI